ncbi:MAG: iron chelate uptake ABC transporter family permease subunit, partial [Bacteroidota bacterium]
MKPRLQRQHLVLTVLALLVSLLFAADLVYGSVPIPFPAVWEGLTGGLPLRPEWGAILTEIRLPKALTAILAGASLATGGLLTQSLFRNPLTGPDAIGLTSGAGLGVALAVLAGAGSSMGLTLAMAASAGAAGSFIIISVIGSRVGGGTLLVAGLMLGAFTSAIVSTLQFFSDARDLQRYTLWT